MYVCVKNRNSRSRNKSMTVKRAENPLVNWTPICFESWYNEVKLVKCKVTRYWMLELIFWQICDQIRVLNFRNFKEIQPMPLNATNLVPIVFNLLIYIYIFYNYSNWASEKYYEYLIYMKLTLHINKLRKIISFYK